MMLDGGDEGMTNRRGFSKVFAALAPIAAGFVSSPRSAQGQQMREKPQLTPAEAAGSPVGDRLPGQRWRVHDPDRPQPRKVTPGKSLASAEPPSDALVLFDGKDLSRWNGAGRGGTTGEPKWKVENGYLELVPGSGGLVTKEAFGDIQVHVEWTTPPGANASRIGQARGNSGVVLMGRYEIQILSGHTNRTYPDGGAGALYGLYPPMVNPCLPEGEWNTFDIVFEAPHFDGEKVVKPAYVTLLFNGLLAHNKVALLGSTSHEPLAAYTPHPAELPLSLQAHIGPARFRNVWLRRLPGYDA